MRLKQLPEDFVVKERYRLILDQSGEYSYYLLEKRDLNTVEACRLIAEKMHINQKFINFAGTKDRRAITFQHISIRRGHKTGFTLPGIKLSYLGAGKERVNLGTHEGNDFEIIVRDIDKLPREISRFPNLFDDQRFGKRQDNHIIGKLIIGGRFREACQTLDEPEVEEWLESHPNDFVGALKRLPKKNLQMYVHAYQSHLWNMTSERYLKDHDGMDEEIPVLGFGYEQKGTDADRIIAGIMEEESLDSRGFIIRQLPELSCESGTRKLFAVITDLVIGDLQDDELNPGKKKVALRFSLGKGSYATLAVKHMFQ